MTFKCTAILSVREKSQHSLQKVILTAGKNPMDESTDLRMKGCFTTFNMTFGDTRHSDRREESHGRKYGLRIKGYFADAQYDV